MDPSGPFKRDPPPPHELRDRHTATADAIVLCHFGIPRLDRATWSLTVDGLVVHPTRLGYRELAQYPKTEIVAVHECCGSPFDPLRPTRRVANLRWGGALLADVLADCRPAPQARFIWSHGADSGAFGGADVDGDVGYVKDLPMSRVSAGVLIAYELNGAPLPAEHGFPARLVVPGFYGTNCVKWLTRIEVTDARFEGPFTTRWYQDGPRDEEGRPTGRMTPVWSIAPESLIVSPADRGAVQRAVPTEIWGWAWADGGVVDVAVRVGDEGWRPATVEAADGWQWQRWTAPWTPLVVGPTEIAVRATSSDGARQPVAEGRNAVHDVIVDVL